MPVISIPAKNKAITAAEGANLLEVLKKHGIYPDAPCGGSGVCGKCTVNVNGNDVLACRTTVDQNITVTLPDPAALSILQDPAFVPQVVDPVQPGHLLAFDIGTTSLVCALLDEKNGAELASDSVQNPQVTFGADVLTRIQAALQGGLPQLTTVLRQAMTELIQSVCSSANVLPESIGTVCVVGNPAMQQFFLGIQPDNLVKIPFAPALTQANTVSCREFLPLCSQAQLLIVPNIAGYVGADTLACLLSTKLYQQEELTLLVDIGTNGELVLGNKHRMLTCATAAGPALEGAAIHFGMRAAPGAIDHVWLDHGKIHCSVIADQTAIGICGSGLVDAVAVGLQLGLINKRGKLLTADGLLHLTEDIYLTQEDIRQVQLAKGAIGAGVQLLAAHLGIEIEDIQTVQLAGAFGSFINPEAACRIGLLPKKLQQRITVVGNAAARGAKLLALDKALLPLSQRLAEKAEFLELSTLRAFPKTFAKAMAFQEAPPDTRWAEAAKTFGFDNAVPLDPQRLQARQDVRAMCAADKCGAYDKNWTCPPAVGTVAECQQKMQQYSHGILLQTIGHMAKTVDSKCYRQTEKRHLAAFYALSEAIRKEYPQALCLGAGGCRICPQCAYPQPCRFPEKAVSSMEGYGLFVTQVCRDAGAPYHHGEKTITYTACILF